VEESSTLRGAGGLKASEGAGMRAQVFSSVCGRGGAMENKFREVEGRFASILLNSGSGSGHTSGENNGAATASALTYATNWRIGGQMKLKDRNITEGWFDDDNELKNASSTGEARTEKDPGSREWWGRCWV
jgi:hypothetical protein